MKPKKTIILTLAILYGLLSFLLFSDSFFIQLIKIQQHYYLKESKKFEKMSFSLQHWQNLENKKEFKLQGHYYDVKKIKIDRDKVTATVIRDEYENILKYVSKNIFPKNKEEKTSKNKRPLLIGVISTVNSPTFHFKKESSNCFFYINTYFKLLHRKIYRPPRFQEFQV